MTGDGGTPASTGDGLRLAVGTLTVLPVSPPGTVDRRTAAWAMTFAPLVGALLAGVAAAVLWLLGWGLSGGTSALLEVLSGQDLLTIRPAPPLLAAALTIGSLALLTRAIHLDGLADTADGLGSGQPAGAALVIMRKSDIGPFGVVTVVLVLLTQVVALAQLLLIGRGPAALALALVVSRLVLPLVCSKGVPAARADGLGRAVAGSVTRLHLLLAIGLSAAIGAVLLPGFVSPFPDQGTGLLGAAVLAAVTAGLALGAGAGMCLWCVRRLGGVTGDVLGACVEVSFTVALVALAML